MEKLKIGNMNVSFLSATRYHINGGILLMVIVLLAMIIANSPWGDAYAAFWNKEVHLQIGEFNLFSHNGNHMTLMNFINDALMTIFFFSGLAIPMATDIAFSLGVLSLFGNRVPISLKIFLTAFAVVDDIGGILVIALFYSSHLDVNFLLYSFGVLFLLCAGNHLHIHNRWFYLLLGLVMWYLFLQSGIHATIAGVIVAFTIPATPHYKIGKYINRIKENIEIFPSTDKEGIILSKLQINVLKSIESASDRVISPLQSLEDSLHGLVNYVIIPLFAFANAGVVLTAGHGGIEVGTPTWAVMVGLVVGKFVGIYFFTWLIVKSGLAGMAGGMNWVNLAGICLLGGIGFTVSLFIANLSFEASPVLLSQAKLGVLSGTVIAGMLGYIVLHFTLPKRILS